MLIFLQLLDIIPEAFRHLDRFRDDLTTHINWMRENNFNL